MSKALLARARPGLKWPELMKVGPAIEPMGVGRLSNPMDQAPRLNP